MSVKQAAAGGLHAPRKGTHGSTDAGVLDLELDVGLVVPLLGLVGDPLEVALGGVAAVGREGLTGQPVS